MKKTVTILAILVLTGVSVKIFAYTCIGQHTVQEEISKTEKKTKGLSSKADLEQTNKDTLIAEKIINQAIIGTYYIQEFVCSRTIKIKSNHRILYKWGCENNKDRSKRGTWKIQNDTLIISFIDIEKKMDFG